MRQSQKNIGFLVEVIIVVVVLAALLAFLIPAAIKHREKQIEVAAVNRVYDAIRAAGNVYRIGPSPSGIADVPGGLPNVLTFEMGRIDDGIAVVLTNNNAAFWVADEVVHVVNEPAKELLPVAPHAPGLITEAEVHRVAK